MGDAESTGNEAQRRRTACAWARSVHALDEEQERIHAGVVTQSMEGDGKDSLWRAMNVIGGGQGTSAEAKEVPEKVVVAVEERWKAGEMQEPLPQGEAGWQAYVKGEKDGRTTRVGGMGGEEWIQSEGLQGGERLSGLQEDTGVWRGEGSECRNLVEEGEGVRGSVWGQEEAVNRSTARERVRQGLCRGAHARASLGSQRGHTVASSEGRPSKCGAGSVRSTEGIEWNSNARQHGHGRGERRH